MRAWFLVLASIVVVGVGERTLAAAIDFPVSNSGATAYVIGGQNNPTLTLTKGQTYTFTTSAFGHPLWIATARGATNAPTNAFPGVTNNGMAPATSGTTVTITFLVPSTAPATLFYQCGIHDAMGGTLNIVAAPVPSMGPVGVAALAGLLLVSALLIIRRRRQALSGGSGRLA
jgi:hypothetical protein